MLCPDCGHRLPEGHTYCKRCLHELDLKRADCDYVSGNLFYYLNQWAICYAKKWKNIITRLGINTNINPDQVVTNIDGNILCEQEYFINIKDTVSDWRKSLSWFIIPWCYFAYILKLPTHMKTWPDSYLLLIILASIIASIFFVIASGLIHLASRVKTINPVVLSKNAKNTIEASFKLIITMMIIWFVLRSSLTIYIVDIHSFGFFWKIIISLFDVCILMVIGYGIKAHRMLYGIFLILYGLFTLATVISIGSSARIFPIIFILIGWLSISAIWAYNHYSKYIPFQSNATQESRMEAITAVESRPIIQPAVEETVNTIASGIENYDI